MDPYLRDVLDVLLRMLHVTAGIAWIGASFYFVRLDLALRPPKSAEDTDAGVAGEFWGVHGGGLYHSQKYRLAPAEMPEPLHWFKWEAYTTWLSGFALMVVLYYFDAGVRLVDPTVADLSDWSAIALSIGGLVLAWIVYDVLCRTLGQRSQLGLAIVGVALVALAAWGAGELFAARAAYLQVGAMLGTIMAANVLLVIIPAHRKLVAAMDDGREPDAAPLLEAKNRSVHNNYLTLPVLFTMLAGHFAFTFGADDAWLVLVARRCPDRGSSAHFFNLWHTGRRAWWILGGRRRSAVVALALLAAARRGRTGHVPSLCLRADPARDRGALRVVPLGRIGTARRAARDRAEIEARADDIERQAVLTRAMPPGNATGMTDEERDLLAAWIAQSR